MKRSLYNVGRKLTIDEWLYLKKWKAENPDLAWKCGDKREDGKVFRVYSRTHSNGERWITVEQFEKERAKNILICKSARSRDRESYNAKNRQRYQQLSEEKRKQRTKKTVEWQRLNPEKVKARTIRYRVRNPDKLAETYRAYVKRHRLQVSIRRSERRLICKQIENLPEHERNSIAKIYWWRDMLNAKHGRVVFHVDHIVPISRGGQHVASNLRVTTAQYNWEKNNRTL